MESIDHTDFICSPEQGGDDDFLVNPSGIWSDVYTQATRVSPVDQPFSPSRFIGACFCLGVLKERSRAWLSTQLTLTGGEKSRTWSSRGSGGSSLSRHCLGLSAPRTAERLLHLLPLGTPENFPALHIQGPTVRKRQPLILELKLWSTELSSTLW